jgi:hypothetical protein
LCVETTAPRESGNGCGVREADEPIRRTVENMTRADRVRKSPKATFGPDTALFHGAFKAERGCKLAPLAAGAALRVLRGRLLHNARVLIVWAPAGSPIARLLAGHRGSVQESNELDGEGIMKPAASRVAR